MVDIGKILKDTSIRVTPDQYKFLQSSLNRLIDVVKQSPNDRTYFLAVADFYSKITNDPILSFLIEPMFLSYQEEQLPLQDIRVKVQDEVNTTYNLLLGEIKKGKLVDLHHLQLIEDAAENLYTKKYSEEEGKIINTPEGLLDGIKDYIWIVRGRTQGGGLQEYSTYRAVGQMIDYLFYHGNADLVEQYVLTEEREGKRQIIGYKFSPTYSNLKETEEIAKLKEEASAWFAFQRLKLVPLCLYDYPVYWEKLRGGNETFMMMNISLIRSELNEVITERGARPEKAIYFKRNLYDYHLLRVTSELSHYLDILLNFSQEVQRRVIEDGRTEKEKGNIVQTEKRMTSLPSEIQDEQLLRQFTFSEDIPDHYKISFGSFGPAYFRKNKDLGELVQIYCSSLGKWWHVKEISKYLWPDSPPKQNLNDKIRTINSDIRRKLKINNLDSIIEIQSGYESIGKPGNGFFRMHLNSKA